MVLRIVFQGGYPMKRKKLVTMVLLVAFILTMAAPAFAASFSWGLTPAPSQDITPERVKQIVTSYRFQSGLNSTISSELTNPANLALLRSLINQELMKKLAAAIKSNDQAAINAVLAEMVADLEAKSPALMKVIAPRLADYIADYLAGAITSNPVEKAQLKAMLSKVILSVLLGQVPADAPAITQALIAQGVDAKIAAAMASGIALLISDDMIQFVAPLIAGLIVDAIGKAAGIPLLPSVKAQLQQRITPIVVEVLKGMKKMALSSQDFKLLIPIR